VCVIVPEIGPIVAGLSKNVAVGIASNFLIKQKAGIFNNNLVCGEPIRNNEKFGNRD